MDMSEIRKPTSVEFFSSFKAYKNSNAPIWSNPNFEFKKSMRQMQTKNKQTI